MTFKDITGKDRLDLLPAQALRKIAKVREYGIKKYQNDDEGWKQVDKRAFATATLRHIYSWLEGQELDPESGLPHLDHAACSILLAISLKENVPYESEHTCTFEEGIKYEHNEVKWPFANIKEVIKDNTFEEDVKDEHNKARWEALNKHLNLKDYP